MAARGAAEEARRAWSRPLSATARKVLGLEQFATLPEHQAVAEVAPRPAGSRAISGSGCDGCPGAVTLAADRLPEEVADEIVALAGAGERLPRH